MHTDILMVIHNTVLAAQSEPAKIKNKKNKVTAFHILASFP